MSRSLPRFALLLLGLLSGAALARGQDDDPSLRGKKLSEWLQMLKEDNTRREDQAVNRRRAGLLAVELIGTRRSRKVLPAIVTALREDSDERVREAAAQALARVVVKSKKDKDESVRVEQVREALAAVLKTDKSGRVREATATALGKLEEDARGAIGVLAGALKDPHPGTRTAAADSLRRLGKEAADALPELQQALQDKQLERLTRVHAALAIGRIGAPDGLTALPALKEVFANSKTPAEVRKAVAETLGRLGKEAAEAAAVLGAALTEPNSDVEVRRAAAVALDQMAPETKAALPGLKKALRDPDKFVRCQAMHALGRMGKELGADSKDVVTGLLQGLDDNVIEVRVAAIETFAALGSEGLGDDRKAVLDRLKATARESQKAVREAAQEAVKKLEGSA
jgi:HEAT repeat protein